MKEDTKILTRVSEQYGADVFVSTQYTFPDALSVPSVLLVHDLTPEIFSWPGDHWRLKGEAVERAASIVTVSGSTAEKLQRFYEEGTEGWGMERRPEKLRV